jgi:rubrerythrin
MSVDFKTSETLKNLMRAFAGESQARNRYTFAASACKQQKLRVVEAIFQFTANQEKEHAEIFYNHMKDLSGETIQIDGGYPVDITNDVVQLLRYAQHNEYEEHDPVYKTFGDTAKEEGFPKVAASFHKIAEIEQTHGNRFGHFADLLERDQLFVSDVSCGWMCLNCGYIFEGKQAPKACPVCDHDQGFFIRLEMAPYGGAVLGRE